jgi:hypothetical protein
MLRESEKVFERVRQRRERERMRQAYQLVNTEKDIKHLWAVKNTNIVENQVKHFWKLFTFLVTSSSGMFSYRRASAPASYDLASVTRLGDFLPIG